MKILLKCSSGQKEVVQLGDVSKGFVRHADHRKLELYIYSILLHKTTIFYHARQISGFPCVTLSINSKVANMIGYYIS